MTGYCPDCGKWVDSAEGHVLAFPNPNGHHVLLETLEDGTRRYMTSRHTRGDRPPIPHTYIVLGRAPGVKS